MTQRPFPNKAIRPRGKVRISKSPKTKPQGFIPPPSFRLYNSTFFTGSNFSEISHKNIPPEDRERRIFQKEPEIMISNEVRDILRLVNNDEIENFAKFGKNKSHHAMSFLSRLTIILTLKEFFRVAQKNFLATGFSRVFDLVKKTRFTSST